MTTTLHFPMRTQPRYTRFMFSGNSLTFNFDVSNMASPPSQVYIKVDNGPATHSLVLDQVTATLPPNNTAIPYHTVELFVKSTTERANRWAAAGASTRIVLTGVTVDAGKGLLPWLPTDVNVLVYGDSITEGVLALAGGGGNLDTNHNDASVVYSYALGALLGGEIGVVGFGYNALLHPGSGGVAPLPVAWDLLWEGVPRSFTTPKPDLIVLNEGTNDACDTENPGCVGTDITTAMTGVLKNLTNACPGTPIAVLLPFNGGQEAHLKAAVAAAASPDIHFIDTTNFYNISIGGSLHPTGMNDVGRIAPQIANKLRPILTKGLAARYAAEMQEQE